MNKDYSESDRAYIIELLAARDLEGLRAFKSQSEPTPIRHFCRVGIDDDVLYDEYGKMLTPDEAHEINKPQESSGNSRYLPQIAHIITCYSTIEQMKSDLIDQYGTN